jgi:hypothetical protein
MLLDEPDGQQSFNSAKIHLHQRARSRKRSSAPSCHHGQPGVEMPHTHPATKLSPSLPQPAGRELAAGRRRFYQRERNDLFGAVGPHRCSLPLPVRPGRRGAKP